MWDSEQKKEGHYWSDNQFEVDTAHEGQLLFSPVTAFEPHIRYLPLKLKIPTQMRSLLPRL